MFKRNFPSFGVAAAAIIRFQNCVPAFGAMLVYRFVHKLGHN